MYTYYKKIKKEEHMLYAKEIAKKYGILSMNNKEATRLVTKVLDEYIEKNNIQEEQLYYITKNGYPSRVYPRHVYMQAMSEFGRDLIEQYNGTETLIKADKLCYNINGTRFNFKLEIVKA